MRLLGLKSVVFEHFKRKNNALSEEEKRCIVNLVKGLKLIGINQVWTTDITYIKTKSEGTFFLITFIDLYSKKVVAWNLCESQCSEDVIGVLKAAIKERKPKPGIIVHSDKGMQMRSHQYRECLEDNYMVASYTSLHHSCDENAVQESFHSLLKKECIYLKQPTDYTEAYGMIYRYIELFYNTRRIHSALGYVSPEQFENALEKSP